MLDALVAGPTHDQAAAALRDAAAATPDLTLVVGIDPPGRRAGAPRRRRLARRPVLDITLARHRALRDPRDADAPTAPLLD